MLTVSADLSVSIFRTFMVITKLLNVHFDHWYYSLVTMLYHIFRPNVTTNLKVQWVLGLQL